MSRLVVWTAVLAAAAAAAALALDPPSAPARPVQPATPLPRLPALPAPPDRGEPLALLATTTAWGPRPVVAAAAASAASAPPPPPRWFVSGTLNTGGQWQAVLRFENNALPTRMLNTGDKLPDGTQVLEIRRDGVRVGPPENRRGKRGKGDAAQPRWIELPRRAFES